MGCFAVIDTNVLVSALISPHPTAATVQVVSKVLAGEITPVYCRDILAEYREVLSRKKFGFPKDLVDNMLAVIEKHGLCVTPGPALVELPDKKDLPFYVVVSEMRKDGVYLVTGNCKHFPEEPFIVTTRQFLDRIEQNNT